MEKYLDQITPNVSDTWSVDELFLKVRGNMKYLYALMDDQTRFWIAQEFYTQRLATRTEHIREIALDGVRHNNKMERMNGELRQREKVMRTLERPDTPILAGMQIYHNHVRPHEALKGKTPSEAAGIEVKGKDKWLTIIQNANLEKTKMLSPKKSRL